MSETTELWMIVILTILGTVIWRGLGVLIGDRIPAGSILSEWVNAVAYAMVSGVMTLIIVFPSGLMAETEISWRLFALFASLSVMVITGKMWLAVIGGVSAFSLALILLS